MEFVTVKSPRVRFVQSRNDVAHVPSMGIAIYGGGRNAEQSVLSAILRYGGTCAEEIAVTISRINAVHHGPEFTLANPWQREGALLAAVFPIPFTCADIGGGVRRMVKWRVIVADFFGFDGRDFFTNGDQGIGKTVEFFLGLRFRWFDHHCPQ